MIGRYVTFINVTVANLSFDSCGKFPDSRGIFRSGKNRRTFDAHLKLLNCCGSFQGSYRFNLPITLASYISKHNALLFTVAQCLCGKVL